MNLREMLATSSRMDVAKLLANLSANLDWRDFGAWPVPLRVGLGAASFAGALAVGGWVVFGGMAARNEALEAEERALRSELAASARQVSNLEQLRSQGKVLENVFADRRARLFAASETAGLIEDITAAAEANHLAIDGIEFADSLRLDHYTGLPMSVRVVGSYHQLGAFAGVLANLRRILTLHDFEIEPGASPGDLRMRLDLKTYQPVEEP